MTEPQYDAFVSYADEDREWVEGYLIDALDRAGVRCHQEAAFSLGVPRLLEFERAVKESTATILVLSPAYFATDVTQLVEVLALNFGAESGIWPVIPLRLHECDLPPRLSILDGLDAVEEANWASVVERLCGHLQRPAPLPSDRPACPYPGMRPFSEEEADRFFGRDAEADELLNCLRVNRFMAVIGPSGSGKSSLVHAALVPALRRSGLFGGQGWAVRSFRPGATPLAALQHSMGGPVDDAAAAVARVLADTPGADKILLVVDQSEELFTSALDDVPPFEEAVVRFTGTARCYVVMTMRADFYPQLMTSSLWDLARDRRVEVLPLRGAALRQAIERPAERVGVFIESALVERLLADAAHEPGLLPLIQETLVCLWERVDRRFLPLSAYEALVLPRAAYGEPECTGLQVAMARRADEAVAALSRSEQVVARRTLIRLVQFGVGRGDVRRQQLATELNAGRDDREVFERVLEHLARHRLVTVSAESTHAGERQVDLAHEALIRGWPTFQIWLNERRTGEETRRRLAADAREWQRLGRGAGGLLDAVELLEAERWASSPDADELGVDQPIRDLVAASREALVRADRHREAARQRELDQARVLAEEQRQRATDQARSARKARRFVAALAVLLVVMLLAFGLAVDQRVRATAQARVAREQAALARSRELAGQARALIDGRRDIALLLGVEAYRLKPTAEARASLREAVERDPRAEAYLVGPITGGLHPSLANAVAFSPDGRWLAAGGDDDIVALWNATTGQVHGRPLVAHPDDLRPDEPAFDVRALAFSADSNVVAAANNDGRIWLWDVASGGSARPPLGDGVDPTHHEMRGLAFHPTNPSVLASGNLDGTVALWDVRTGLPLRSPWLASAGVNAVAFSPDGRLLAAAADDGSVVIWDTATAERVGPPMPSHVDRARAVAFSPDGTRLASSGNDNRVFLTDLTTGQAAGEALTGHTDYVYDVAFSPDGTWLASASADLTARIWHVDSRALDPPPIVHAASVNAVAFGPDGTLATSSRDRTTGLWRLDRPSGAATVTDSRDAVNAVAVSPNGHLIASGDDRGIVYVADGSPTVATLGGFNEAVTSVALSPDGTRLAAGSWDSQVLVWDVATRRLVARLQDDPSDGVLAIAFSPDGRTVAAGGAKGSVRLWDVTTQRVHAVLHGPDRPGPDGRLSKASIEVEPEVRSVAFTPDGRTLVAASQFGGVWRWPADGSRPEGDRLTPWGGPAYSVAVTPDGRSVISGGLDGDIAIRDVAGPAPQPHGRLQLKGQFRRITAVVIAPDRRMLATASENGTIALWDLDTGQLREGPFRAGSAAVNGLAFTVDGRLLSATGDGRVSVRDLNPEGLVVRACEIARHDLLPSDWEVYLSGLKYRSTCGDLRPR